MTASNYLSLRDVERSNHHKNITNTWRHDIPRSAPLRTVLWHLSPHTHLEDVNLGEAALGGDAVKGERKWDEG